MNWFLWGFAVMGVALLYFFIIRPIIKSAPVFSEIFAKEASLIDKWRAIIVGWRTKIMARLFVLGGVLLGFYDMALPVVMGQDWSSITNHLPPWAMPVVLTVTGLLFTWLRKITDNPPVVVTQQNEAGVPQVVAVVKTP